MVSELSKRVHRYEIGRAERILDPLVFDFWLLAAYSVTLSLMEFQEAEWLSALSSSPLEPFIDHHRGTR